MTNDAGNNKNVELLEREIKYYRQRLDEITAKTLQSDLTITRLRRVENQKQKAFNLLSSLQRIIGTTKDYTTIFRDTIDLITSTIGMDKSILLVPDLKENYFTPFCWAGYTDNIPTSFNELIIEFPPEFSKSPKSIIVNSFSEKTPFTRLLQTQLKLPFFICTSVVYQGRVDAIILAGRNVEKLPFYEPINSGDIDTFQAIAGFLESILLSLNLAEQAENAQKQKIQADAQRDAKEKFFANMSHELRTPLNAILGYSDMALEPNATKTDRVDSLNIIYRSGKHLLQLINNILDLSKIEANKDQLDIIDISLFNLFNEIEEMFIILSSQKGITFLIEYDYPLPKLIRTDSLKFKQILINLCGNAIKFTEKGYVSIFISYLSPDNKLQVKIKDSGIGISSDHLEDIFEQFTQADKSTARNFGGTGLGLHLSKKYANLLGGDITAISETGKGSTFIVSIDPGKIDKRVLVTSPQKKGQQITNRKNDTLSDLQAKILYAENDKYSQQLVCNLLAQTKMTIDVVDNGALALAAYQNGQYDLVLTDIRMPLMDGTELTEKLLRINPDLCVIAITTNATELDLHKYAKVGFKRVLEKPIQKQKLFDTLRKFLIPIVENT